MRSGRRWIVGILGFAGLAFGLACLNYTKADAIEHHRAVAEREGLPLPTPAIFKFGVAGSVLGAGVVGFAIGKGNSRTST